MMEESSISLTVPAEPARSRLRRTRIFLSTPAGVVGAGLLASIIVIAILSPVIAPSDPLGQIYAPLRGPSFAHPFGTDELGRDILSRVIYGSRDALVTAGGSALVAAGLGVPIGLLAGYAGRWADAVFMRIVDVLLALPGIIVALVVVSVLGAGSTNLILAIGVGAAPTFARLARASTLVAAVQEYVLASRGMGARSSDIVFRTILPNILPPLIVQCVVTAAVAVVAAASLSFLGLGEQPPAPTWGGMLQEARVFLHQSPWYGVAPGIALVITIVSFDGIGNGLQRALGTTRLSKSGGEA